MCCSGVTINVIFVKKYSSKFLFKWLCGSREIGFQNIFTNGSYKLDPAVATDNQRPEGLWNK
jgi:hypothetical protein